MKSKKLFLFLMLIGLVLAVSGYAIVSIVLHSDAEPLKRADLFVLSVSFLNLLCILGLGGLFVFSLRTLLKKHAESSPGTPERNGTEQLSCSDSDAEIEHEIFYRAAFVQAAVGIAQVDINGRWIDVNQRLCDTLGYEKEELLQTNFQALTHPDDLKYDLNMLQKVLSDEIKTYRLDKRFYTKQGKEIWISLAVSLVRDLEHKPKYFISIVEDITKRKKFEFELEESKLLREQLLRGRDLASEAGGISNWTWDIVSNDLIWDERMYEIYGVDEAEAGLDYNTWRERVHPDDLVTTEQKLKETIENFVPFSAEFRIFHKQNGEIRWVKAAADVVTENGKAIKMFGVNLDMTEERLTQIALEKEGHSARQASEAKSNFLATMSHEIRTPMNGVIGMIDLLRETKLNLDQKRMIGTIRESAFSLLEIINGILDFSKIESGKMELDLSPVSLLAIIERCVEGLWGHAVNQNVKVYIIPDFNTPAYLLLDPVRVRQIIVNILGNAIKFSQGGNKQGVVFVRTATLTSLENRFCIGIEVIDNGVGMTESQITKLFQPFTQADSSTTRKYGGTGLGLSITKSFVDLMNGYIDVESTPESGSAFNIVIPVNTDSVSEKEFSNVNLSGVNAFVALTDENLTKVVCNILEQMGCCYFKFDEFETVTSIGNYIDNSIDVVIVDRESTANKFMKVSDNHSSDWPRFLILNEQLASDRSEVRGNTYIASCQPLKPSEFVHALSVITDRNNPAYGLLQSTAQDSEISFTQYENDIEDFDSLILVAEDQPTNQDVIGQQLSRLGYHFEMANDGFEAFEKWRTGRFGIVLTDCHMPNMDGWELTAEIRKEEQDHQLPKRTVVIAITANALVGEADHCLESGMDDYLSKPVELNKLRNKLALWIGRLSQEGDASSSQNIPPEFLNAEVNHSAVTEYDVVNHPPIDYEQLKEILGTDEQDVINSILSSYQLCLDDYFSEVKDAIAHHDSEQLRQSSHAAKGASNSSGVGSLGVIFKELEILARDKNWDEISKIEPGLKQEIERVENYIKKEHFS